MQTEIGHFYGNGVNKLSDMLCLHCADTLLLKNLYFNLHRCSFHIDVVKQFKILFLFLKVTKALSKLNLPCAQFIGEEHFVSQYHLRINSLTTAPLALQMKLMGLQKMPVNLHSSSHWVLKAWFSESTFLFGIVINSLTITCSTIMYRPNSGRKC